MAPDLTKLEKKRQDLLNKLAQLGDMRAGSIIVRYRRCGKHPCCCEDLKHKGHGPYYSFTSKVHGKTRTQQLKDGPVLQKVMQEIERYREFVTIIRELVSVNEQICELRPVEEAIAKKGIGALKKKLLRYSRKR